MDRDKVLGLLEKIEEANDEAAEDGAIESEAAMTIHHLCRAVKAAIDLNSEAVQDEVDSALMNVEDI